jgi:hypothetical protein
MASLDGLEVVEMFLISGKVAGLRELDLAALTLGILIQAAMDL